MVAAGSGVRLGAGTPKALREVRGRALVAHAVANLVAGGCTHVVVVTAPELADAFAEVLEDCGAPIRLAAGGAERQDSVANGLEAIAADPALADSRFVLVHDAARAFVPPSVVARVIAALRAGAVGVIPVLPVVDSIREVTGDSSRVVERAALRIVQTPQGFDRALLVQAHAHVSQNALAVTDDAAALEALGQPVTLVPGAREAMKVTEPFDLRVAELLAEE